MEIKCQPAEDEGVDMSLMSALWTGYSGLQVSQLATDIVSNNIANTDNPIYTRQRVDISSRFSLKMTPGDIGTGSKVDQVIRVHNEFVYSRYRDASTNLEYQNYLAQALTEVSGYFPDIDEVGIQRDLIAYFGAWQKLSMNPTESAQKVVLAEAAKNLGKNLTTLRSKLSDMQKQADIELVSMVDEVNKISQEIAGINKKIRELESTEYNHANMLRDERDNLELQLQKLTGAQIIKTGLQTMTKTDTNVADYDENYSIMIGGFNIVNDHTFNKISADKAEYSAGGQNAIYFIQRDYSKIDISKDIVGGKIGAILDLRGRTFNRETGEQADGILQKYKDMLDVFSRGIIQSTNQIYASSSVASMSSDLIGSSVGLSAREAKTTFIANLDKDKLYGKTQKGDMVITAYNRDGTRIYPDIRVTIDPETMSLQHAADAINAQLNALNLDGEATIAGGQLVFNTGTTGNAVKLGALLMSEDHSLVSNALGMIGTQKLNIVDEVHIPFTISNGSFTVGVYDSNGTLLAAREIFIDKTATNPLYSTLDGIAAQINMPFVDDNKDNDMTNDVDNLIFASFGGNRFDIGARDQNGGVFFNITDNGTGFAGAIGLNKFFTGTGAKDIDLRSDFKNDPSKIQAYDLPVVGNNEIANAMQQLQYQDVAFFSGDRSVKYETIMGQYKFTAGIVAEDTSTIMISLETATAIENNIGQQFDSISRVNVDEELTNLIRFQAAYSANARVISTIQLMLDTLLGIKL
ncbi:hypothetical protein FACS189487_00970 [Campylobacterota bacterium]|nr:hypothetical protein FACS189487_00970 [Campylobacterota bacterium]